MTVEDDVQARYGRAVRPTSRRQLAVLASYIRENIFEAPAGYFDIIRYMELALPSRMPGFVLDVVEHEEMGNLEGLTFPDEKIIRLRSDVYEGAYEGNARARFTVAHEFGHLLLHAGHARAESKRPPKPYEQPEWQADNFAAELLMPVKEIASVCISAGEIAAQYGVSLQAAQVRLKTILKM